MNHIHDFERSYWGDCTNTFDEEQKHYVYAQHMRIERKHYSFIAPAKRILDVGGGPTSMLLKTEGLQHGLVWDPIEYPIWTRDRYRSKNIDVRYAKGEDLTETGWDEVWIYNCLQHTDDPAKVIDRCLKAAKIIRIFEWVDIPPHEGHPHMLSELSLNAWLGLRGTVTQLTGQNGCSGKAYSAVGYNSNIFNS